MAVTSFSCTAALATLLLASAAGAGQLTQSWWTSDEMDIVVRFDWPDFYVRPQASEDWTHCRATGEQASFGVADARCSDGSRYAVEIGATHVRFDGRYLTPHEHDPAGAPGNR